MPHCYVVLYVLPALILFKETSALVENSLAQPHCSLLQTRSALQEVGPVHKRRSQATDVPREVDSLTSNSPKPNLGVEGTWKQVSKGNTLLQKASSLVAKSNSTIRESLVDLPEKDEPKKKETKKVE